MHTPPNRREIRANLHRRIRARLRGTAERPRLAVFRSTKHIYAQVIDDLAGRTLASASTREGDLKGSYGGNTGAAEKVGALDNATLWFGADAVGFAQYDDHVTLDVSRSGETTTLRGRYLIAADGGQSAIRQKAGIGFGGKTYEAVTLVAITDFPFEDHYEGLSGVNYIWTESSNFSLLRVPDRWRSGITPKPGQTPEEAFTDESIQAHFQAIVPRPEPYDVLAKGMYRTHQRVADTFNVGRIVLAGDAAHLNSPSGGLGMNCGVHDAINLVSKLEQVWHGADPALFDRYTRQRRAVAVKYVHEISNKNHFRIRERDPARRREIMDDLQRIAGDPALSKPYLMRTSMIEAMRYAESIE